jgi:hypothetical protein
MSTEPPQEAEEHVPYTLKHLAIDAAIIIAACVIFSASILIALYLYSESLL